MIIHIELEETKEWNYRKNIIINEIIGEISKEPSRMNKIQTMIYSNNTVVAFMKNDSS